MRGAARAPLPKEANPMSDVTLRAQVLAEALPYIQKYYGTVSYTHLTLPTNSRV